MNNQETIASAIVLKLRQVVEVNRTRSAGFINTLTVTQIALVTILNTLNFTIFSMPGLKDSIIRISKEGIELT